MPEVPPTALPPTGPAPTAPAPAAAVPLSPELVRAHQAAVWRYLRVLGAGRDEADDLAQETFVVLLRTPLADHGPNALRAWLRATARNLFLASCRRLRREPVALDDGAVERAWAAYERDDDGDGYRAALQRCLETLPARQREVLALQVEERAPVERIAAVTGLAAEGARSLLRRIKQALRDCVRRRLHDGT